MKHKDYTVILVTNTSHQDDYRPGENTIPLGAWLIKDPDAIITGDKQNIRWSLGK